MGASGVGISFLNRVQQHLPELTKGQRKVSECLMQDERLLAFATIAEIGRAADVSETTVIRLARSLGYPNFVAMQEEAQREMEFQRIRAKIASPQPQAEGAPHQRILDQELDLLARTRDGLTEVAYQQAVDLASKARRIYVTGAKLSYAVAFFLVHLLKTLRGQTVLLDPSEPGFMQDLAEMGPADVLIAISFPRYSLSTIDCCRFARKKGCPVIAITDGLLSPLADGAHAVLPVVVESLNLTDSYAPVVAVAQALATGVFQAQPEASEQVLALVEQTTSEWAAIRPPNRDDVDR